MTCSKSLQHKASSYDLVRCLSSLWLCPTAAMLVFGYICFFDPMGEAALWDDYKYAVLSYGHAAEFFIYSLLYLAAGALTALHAFSFLFSTKKCNVYLSLPLTRKELYRNRLLSALPFMLLSVIVPMVLSYIGNKTNYTVTPECITAMLYIALALLSVMLLGFAIGSVFAVSVGNIFEAAAYSALGIFLPYSLTFSVEEIMENLINGAPVSTSWAGRFAAYCMKPTRLLKPADPIHCFVSAVYRIANQLVDENPKSPTAADFMPMIAWFVAFALLSVLAQKLLIKRRAETAGSFGSGKAAVIFTASVLSILAFAVVTTYAYRAKALVTILCIVLPAIIYIAVVALVFRNKDDIRRNLKGMAVAAALSLFVLFTCSTELFGYFTTVPEQGEIESVIVCPAASENLFKADSFAGGSISKSPGIYGKMTSAPDIEFAVTLHKKTVKSLGKGDNNIGFVYRLKDGRYVTRYYRNASAEAAKESLKAVETDWYKETVYSALTTENYDYEKANEKLNGDIYKNNYDINSDDYEYRYGVDISIIELRREFSQEPMILCNSTLSSGKLLTDIMSKAELTEFRRVMATELVSLSAEDIFLPKEKIPFYITFSDESYDYGVDEFIFSSGASLLIPVYPAMTNTLEFISRYNINMREITAEDIKLVRVVPYEKALRNDTTANRSIFEAVDKIVMIDRTDVSEEELGHSTFLRQNEKDIVVYEDRATIEKYFNSFRGAYAALDNKGYMVRFVLNDGTYFHGFVTE